MLRCAISVDLDEIPNYFAIHGVQLDDCDRHAVYDRALERLQNWAHGQQLPLTLFAVGSDLERAESASRLRAMRGAGHEIANHSLDHLYDLTRRSTAEMERQVRGGIEAIERATGVAPTGFRAPGYVTTDALYQVLVESGVSYSSSVFPCPWYYSPKVAAIGIKRAFGRVSSSLVDDPRVLLAPRRPYRVGVPYWRRGEGLLELPIAVTPKTRLPFIGTNLVVGGPGPAAWLARRLIGEPLVNLELHGVDVLDRQDDLESLARHQPDLRVSVARKLEALDSVVYTLRRAGYSFCTLAEAARGCTAELVA
jgi:hypothetical protein